MSATEEDALRSALFGTCLELQQHADEVARLRALVDRVAEELDEACTMAQRAQGEQGAVWGPISKRLALLVVVLRDGLAEGPDLEEVA